MISTKYLSADEEARLLEKAKRLRADGLPWAEISRRMLINPDWIRRRIDPEYRDNANRALRERMHGQRCPRSYSNPDPRLCQKVPKDTRDNTARICGDPLPGRSALDQRGQQ
jgi:hypothetical protein